MVAKIFPHFECEASRPSAKQTCSFYKMYRIEQKILDDFHKKLTYERVKNVNIFEYDIKTAYKEILQGGSISYAEYRKYIPEILSSLEINNVNSVPYSVDLFFELYQKLIDIK